VPECWKIPAVDRCPDVFAARQPSAKQFRGQHRPVWPAGRPPAAMGWWPTAPFPGRPTLSVPPAPTRSGLGPATARINSVGPVQLAPPRPPDPAKGRFSGGPVVPPPRPAVQPRGRSPGPALGRVATERRGGSPAAVPGRAGVGNRLRACPDLPGRGLRLSRVPRPHQRGGGVGCPRGVFAGRGPAPQQGAELLGPTVLPSSSAPAEFQGLSALPGRGLFTFPPRRFSKAPATPSLGPRPRGAGRAPGHEAGFGPAGWVPPGRSNTLPHAPAPEVGGNQSKFRCFYLFAAARSGGSRPRRLPCRVLGSREGFRPRRSSVSVGPRRPSQQNRGSVAWPVLAFFFRRG